MFACFMVNECDYSQFNGMTQLQSLERGFLPFQSFQKLLVELFKWSTRKGQG